MIDDQVIAAKELYASQMGFENQMRYKMVKASEAGKGQILSRKRITSNIYVLDDSEFATIDAQFDMTESTNHK